MRRAILFVAVLAVLVSSVPAEAVTRSGKATPSGGPIWNIFHGPGGMLVVTVYWKTRNRYLFLVGACNDGSSFVSGSLQDRFSQVEIEVDPDTTCEVQVRSRGGSSKYWINFRGSGIFGSNGAATPGLEVGRARAPSPVLDELAKLGKSSPPR